MSRYSAGIAENRLACPHLPGDLGGELRNDARKIAVGFDYSSLKILSAFVPTWASVIPVSPTVEGD